MIQSRQRIFGCSRGSRIQAGMIVDIVILHPDEITEQSNYESGKNGLPTKGIPYVPIGGQLAVEDSKVNLDIRAGQAIRFQPMTM